MLTGVIMMIGGFALVLFTIFSWWFYHELTRVAIKRNDINPGESLLITDVLINQVKFSF